MRVLFLNPAFPGRYRGLAQAFGALQNTTVLFLSESGQKTALPGVRRLRLSPPSGSQSDDPAEREIVMRLQRGARAGNAMLALRKDGFIPDIVCAASTMGGSLYVRDIFPEAYYVVQADWFYTQGETHCFFTRGRPRPPADFAPARVCNLWEYNALGDSDLAVTSSLWQREQYPDFLAREIKVVHSGINTRFFSPRPVGGKEADDAMAIPSGAELVSFCGPLRDAARGFAQFKLCLPRLLALRPNCLVLLSWLENAPGKNGKNGKNGAEDTEGELRRGIEALDLDASQRARVHLLGGLQVREYRQILRASTAHVYLAAPYALSTGLLEAMACGAAVVGSDTPPVREVVQDGVNGFLCDFWNPDNMADVVAKVLERAKSLDGLRRNARQTVLREHDADTQARRYMDLITACMEAR